MYLWNCADPGVETARANASAAAACRSVSTMSKLTWVLPATFPAGCEYSRAATRVASGDTRWVAGCAEAVAVPAVAAMKDTASPKEPVRAHHRAGFIICLPLYFLGRESPFSSGVWSGP